MRWYALATHNGSHALCLSPLSCMHAYGLGLGFMGCKILNPMHARAAGVDAGVFLVRNSAWTRALFDRLADVARSLPLPTSVVRTPAGPSWTPQHPALYAMLLGLKPAYCLHISAPIFKLYA